MAATNQIEKLKLKCRNNILFKSFVIAILISIPQCVMGQDVESWQTLMENVVETEDIERDEWLANYDLWEELSHNPINLNTATWEDLSRITFLTDEQIDDILAYVWQYGPVRTTAELAMIESIDYYERRLLQCFVSAEDVAKEMLPTWKNVMKYGKHDVTLSANIPFYKRQGDKDGYLGYPYRHSFRYKFNYSNKLKIGLVGAQDAGEPFFADKNSLGYDYYSFYASISNVGRLKTLIVGRYRASFGMGLVLNTNLNFGRLMNVTSFGRRRSAIVEHSSRSTNNYLQGAAASIDIAKNININAIVSYRSIDATLSSGNKSIQTILTTGYHRTETELARKSNAEETITAINANYNNNGWHLGMSALYNRYSLPLKPNHNQIYRRWFPEGKSFWNAGVDYGYRNYMFSFQGETAIDMNGNIATINRLTYDPMSQLQLIALQRFYSYQYIACHANSLSINSRLQNESGIYFGAQWIPLQDVSINAYMDYAHFAWPRYQANYPSNSMEFLIQTNIVKNNWTFFMRYSYKNKQKNNENKTKLTNDATHRLRLTAKYNTNTILLRSQIDYCRNTYKVISKGYVFSQMVNFKINKRTNMAFTAAYFNTDDYQSRSYIYDQGLLYSMPIIPLYGNGLYISTRLKANVAEKLMLIGKFSYTKYFDRNKISSGLQQIDASYKSDLEIQLNYKF